MNCDKSIFVLVNNNFEETESGLENMARARRAPSNKGGGVGQVISEQRRRQPKLRVSA